MATDVVLDQGSDGNWVVVQAPVLDISGHDLILDSADRRKDPRGYRRALVHDGGDGLTINFNNDYPGGVWINDAQVQVHVENQDGSPRLPRDGVTGQLMVTRSGSAGEGRVALGQTVTLWLCLGRDKREIIGDVGATWVPITTGAPVTGDA